jgi:hypothetical protein
VFDWLLIASCVWSADIDSHHDKGHSLVDVVGGAAGDQHGDELGFKKVNKGGVVSLLPPETGQAADYPALTSQPAASIIRLRPNSGARSRSSRSRQATGKQWAARGARATASDAGDWVSRQRIGWRVPFAPALGGSPPEFSNKRTRSVIQIMERMQPTMIINPSHQYFSLFSSGHVLLGLEPYWLNAVTNPRTQAVLVAARALLSPRLSIQETHEILPCPKTASAAVTWLDRNPTKIAEERKVQRVFIFYSFE